MFSGTNNIPTPSIWTHRGATNMNGDVYKFRWACQYEAPATASRPNGMMKRASTFLPSKNPTIGIIAMVKNAEGERIKPAWYAS